MKGTLLSVLRDDLLNVRVETGRAAGKNGCVLKDQIKAAEQLCRSSGSSARDESQQPSRQPLPPAPWSQPAVEPLTDEDLDAIEAWISRAHSHGLPFAASETEMLLRLAAEVRRLRSDAWLAPAAEEIADSANPYDWRLVLAILRKHRDDKG